MMKALIADDHELFSWALQSLLMKSLGFEHVQLVGTFQDTLQALSDDPEKDLLCLDLSMPGMNGFNSVREIQQASPPGLKIIIVTASGRREYIAEAKRTKVAAFVLKTMSTAEVSAAIRDVIDGKTFVPAMQTRRIFAETALKMRSARRTGPDRGVAPIAATPLLDNVVSGFLGPKVLTRQQRAVGNCIIRGRSNKEIAIELGISEGTVKAHVAALFRTLKVRNRAEAASVLMMMQ